MSKTPEEMASEWYWANITDECPIVMLSNPAKYPPCPRKAFLAGYQAAKEEANFPTSAKWISVKDRLPEEGALVLLTDKDDSYNRISIGYRMFSEFDGHSWYVPGKVLLPEHFYTHWQPLPQAPKEEV